jgi:trehalose 6-phosphate phosphatase
MSPSPQAELGRFFEHLSRSRQAVLLLDYDGTLAPFRIKRDEALPYPGIVPALEKIIGGGHTRVIVISGRDIHDLLPLLDLRPRPEIWGIHGLQRLHLDGTIHEPSLDEQTLEGLSEAERWLTYQQLSDSAERKSAAIAVHWRGLNEVAIEDLRSRVLLGWQLIAAQRDLNLLEFDGGVEIRAREANKGSAVRGILSDLDPDVPVAYLGDDTTDESAFRAIGNRGLTVLVRPEWRHTFARCWLKPPEEVLEFLARWDNSSANSKLRNRAAKAMS